jgi:hypothetical protein
MGGLITFLAIPLALTVYFVVIAIGAHAGAEWAVNKQTHIVEWKDESGKWKAVRVRQQNFPLSSFHFQ